MTPIEDLIEFVRAMEGVLLLQPEPGDGSPEIAWGDAFFYYAPDGVVPKTQPFATIVTKDYPGDETSRLNRPYAYRVNVAAGKAEFEKWTEVDGDDVIIRHPVYGAQHWLAVTNPGPKTTATIEGLLRTAHRLARQRFLRHLSRAEGKPAPSG